MFCRENGKSWTARLAVAFRLIAARMKLHILGRWRSTAVKPAPRTRFDTRDRVPDRQTRQHRGPAGFRTGRPRHNLLDFANQQDIAFLPPACIVNRVQKVALAIAAVGAICTIDVTETLRLAEPLTSGSPEIWQDQATSTIEWPAIHLALAIFACSSACAKAICPGRAGCVEQARWASAFSCPADDDPLSAPAQAFRERVLGLDEVLNANLSWPGRRDP